MRVEEAATFAASGHPLSWLRLICYVGGGSLRITERRYKCGQNRYCSYIQNIVVWLVLTVLLVLQLQQQPHLYFW